jgi:prepilin-type N-terminal cleavage/methylation domain-containing protein
MTTPPYLNPQKKPSSTQQSQPPGFTLVEILVASIISAFILITVGYVLTRFIQDSQRVVTITNLQKTADQTLLNLSQEMRWAKTIQASTSDEQIEFTNDIQEIKYYKDGTNLKKDSKFIDVPLGQEHETTETLNPPSIQISTFKVINRASTLDRPSIDVTLIINSQNGKYVYSNHTAITPRNKFPGAI